MLTEVLLLLLAGGAAPARLAGDNVCRDEKRYVINVTEYFLRNSTIRNYQWCMNVPPRCSFYTTKLINDSRVVEKEVADLVDVCCSGYAEDVEAGGCVPACSGCRNGTCASGKCECHPGYKGESCEFGCDGLEWGRNCEFKCDCGGADCHSESGECFCPLSSTGRKCDSPCKEGVFGANCRQNCTCTPCDPRTGQCLTTPPPPPVVRTIPFSNNGRLSLIPSTVLSSTDEAKMTEPPPNDHISVQTNAGPVPDTKRARAKVRGQEVDGENYLNDDTSRGNPEVNKRDLVNSASAATAISAGIIVVAGLIVAANHFKRRQAKGDEGRKGVSTVAVYTHSIFHTPLPDPPTFEPPMFASANPSEANSPPNEGRFETHVVCSMNFPNHAAAKDPREYLYDHPPSTGSYRAASVPEPPDVEIAAHLEPLYDEIPAGVVPASVCEPPPVYRSAGSVYMNTCGKTQF